MFAMGVLGVEVGVGVLAGVPLPDPVATATVWTGVGADATELWAAAGGGGAAATDCCTVAGTGVASG